MIRALTSWSDLAAAQRAFRSEFYERAELLTRTVGFPGGSTEVDIAWHGDVGLWGYVDQVESANGPDGAGGRYWNAFGLDDPHRAGGLSITVEVNPPLQGTNGRVGGIFGHEKDGTRVLLHRGTIGGARSGVGKDLF
ncbi:MAG: hypothetical protein AMXMBFR23_15360 [Chloroflexota bacterium]